MPPLPSTSLREVLRLLTGGEPAELPPRGLPFYNHPNRRAFVQRMPRFDKWGLLPEVQVDPCDALLMTTPAPGGPEVSAPRATEERSGLLAPQASASAPPSGAGDGPPGGTIAAPAMECYAPDVSDPSPGSCVHRGKRKSMGRNVPPLGTLRKRKWIALDE